MAELYIGTSGYDYPEWRGIFYPPDISREEFLGFYAGVFNALELNYTYYSLPDEYQMASMIKRTSERVHFSVKAHQSMTHCVQVSTWRDSAREFRKALYPLEHRGLLLSVLLQFPQSFHYTVDERRYLDSLVKELSGLPLVVEFRHASWQNQRVYTALQKLNIGWCVCDMPALKALPKGRPGGLAPVTATRSYLRFHGRNSTSWYGGDSRSRYEYLYQDAELDSYIPVVDSLCRQSQIVQIYFNNHAKGNAVVNAQKMKILASKIPL